MVSPTRRGGLNRQSGSSCLQTTASGQSQKIADILAAIDTAEQPAEVALFPGWRLHLLKGALKGFWSVTITGNWRLLFRFEDGDAFDVDLVDYH